MQLNNKFWAKYLAIVFAFLVSFFALTGCSAASGTTIGDSFNKILETGSNIIGNSSSNSGGSSSAVSGTLTCIPWTSVKGMHILLKWAMNIL